MSEPLLGPAATFAAYGYPVMTVVVGADDDAVRMQLHDRSEDRSSDGEEGGGHDHDPRR